MKLRVFLFMIAIACALALSITKTGAQDKAKGDPKPAADMQEMMKKYMEAATPSEGHKFLEQFVGKWDMAMRMWGQGPDKPPTETKGGAEVKWVLDGHFLLEEGTGQIMGMAYKSMGLTGFDNFKKKYVFSYVDNMGTALFTGEGKLDLEKKVLTSFGKMDEPMTGETDKPTKYVTRFISKDKHIFEIYDEVGSPNEFKALEITYTRKP